MSPLQVVVLLTALTGIVVISEAGKITKERAQEFLNNVKIAFDDNKDGKISGTELAQAFRKEDANGDNKIDPPEFLNYLKKHNTKFVDRADLLFLIFDNDKSGYVDLEDSWRLLKELDGDGDGSIDDNEFESFHKNFLH